jgi:hypothetical protein
LENAGISIGDRPLNICELSVGIPTVCLLPPTISANSLDLIEDCTALKIRLNGTRIAEPITLICEEEIKRAQRNLSREGPGFSEDERRGSQDLDGHLL